MDIPLNYFNNNLTEQNFQGGIITLFGIACDNGILRENISLKMRNETLKPIFNYPALFLEIEHALSLCCKFL
jgi:hypothetical protein